MRLARRARGRRFVLYSTPGCGLCVHAAALLRGLRIGFDEVDASDDPDRMLRVPVIEADGVVVAEGRIEIEDIERGMRRKR